MVVGWLIPRAVPYPRRRRGTEGPQSNYRHDPHMLHFGIFFFLFPALHKIIFPELLVEKEAATLQDLFQSGLGQGRAGLSVLVFQSGRTGFCTKRKAGVAESRLPACTYVYICTYTVSSTCTFNSYTRIHAHTQCRRCSKSTLVRMGICIAYIFTCTISRCV